AQLAHHPWQPQERQNANDAQAAGHFTHVDAFDSVIQSFFLSSLSFSFLRSLCSSSFFFLLSHRKPPRCSPACCESAHCRCCCCCHTKGVKGNPCCAVLCCAAAHTGSNKLRTDTRLRFSSSFSFFFSNLPRQEETRAFCNLSMKFRLPIMIIEIFN